MALSVKRITLWRADVENRPGILAEALDPLAEAGADLRLVMGYRFPQTPERSAIEVFPVSGRRATAAAQRAGLTASDIPCVLLEGDDRPGFGAAMARALADAQINIAFCMAQAIGRKFAAVVGFADEDTARRAMPILRKLGAPRRPAKRTPRR